MPPPRPGDSPNTSANFTFARVQKINRGMLPWYAWMVSLSGESEPISVLTQVISERLLPRLRDIFSFPNPVNEVAARIVAAMVVTLSLITILTGQSWLMFLLAYGFLARVATGPTLSPMGLLATRVIAPRIAQQKLVPGPPKRFAQTVGLAFSMTALVLHFAAGLSVAAGAVLAVLTVFAALESFLGFCAGCFVFNYMIRWGLVPKSVCEECLNFDSTRT